MAFSVKLIFKDFFSSPIRPLAHFSSQSINGKSLKCFGTRKLFCWRNAFKFSFTRDLFFCTGFNYNFASCCTSICIFSFYQKNSPRSTRHQQSFSAKTYFSRAWKTSSLIVAFLMSKPNDVPCEAKQKKMKKARLIIHLLRQNEFNVITTVDN